MSDLLPLSEMGPQTASPSGMTNHWFVGNEMWGREPRMANEDRIMAVYMMANRKQGAIYTGVTSNLVQRVWQHREGVFKGFSRQYGCKTLVWYELHEEISRAIADRDLAEQSESLPLCYRL